MSNDYPSNQPNEKIYPQQPAQFPQYPPQGPQQPYPPQMPPPYQRPPKRPMTRAAKITIGVVLLGLCAFSAIFNASVQQGRADRFAHETATAKALPPTPTAAPTKPPTPTATPKPLSFEDQVKKELKDQSALIQDKDPDVVYEKGSKKLLIMAYQGIAWDAGAAQDQVKMNCFGAQKAIWKSGLSNNVAEIQVQVFGPTQDKYGKQNDHGYVGNCVLGKNTAAKFAWDNLTWNTAWDDYDSKWLLGT